MNSRNISTLAFQSSTGKVLLYSLRYRRLLQHFFILAKTFKFVKDPGLSLSLRGARKFLLVSSVPALLQVSRVRSSQKSAIIFVVLRLIVPWARRMEYRTAGRENAYVSSGGEQRVTRGSILYRGRGPPLVTRCVFPYARPLPFAANGSGGHAEAERGHTEDVVGALPCASPSALSYPRLVACLRE